MQGQTILFILLSGIIALLLALFQYVYKLKINKLNGLLAALRFLTYFGILLLILNPKLEKTILYNEKPNLVIAVDNSSSISYLGYNEEVLKLIEDVKSNEDLNQKFNIEFYSFGSDIKNLDSITFDESRTNISKVFSTLKPVHKNSVSPTILITDGNQTFGSDYEFVTQKYNQPIYTIILGDTITYSDLKIEQLNVNRYAYFKNKFPIEAILNYNGLSTVKTNFIVKNGNQVVYRKPISFSKSVNSLVFNFNLLANSVGLKSYRAEIVPIGIEKNTVNNSKDFGVEVINQKSNIAIISNIVHPDLGALKKSIESVEQRNISILNSKEVLNKIIDFQLIIFYQPNNTFKSVYEEVIRLKKNYFTITGPSTDWTFLNSIQNNYSKKVSGLTEEYQPLLNENFSAFIVNDLDFQSFPPLKSSFDPVVLNTRAEKIFFKSVNGIVTDQPLLTILEYNNIREAILFGEGIWKWRAHSYLKEKSFIDFDTFMAKLMLYLSSNDEKSRLSISNESFNYTNDDITISAQYFNKNYEMDSSVNLLLEITDENTGLTRILPFIYNRNKYQINLSNLAASDYVFRVKVDGQNISKSSSFKVIEYNVEQQFLNANISKLKTIASYSNGESYFVQDTDKLFSHLMEDNRYQIIQKSNKNTVPLIDFKILLLVIVLSLAIEWFLRKYNGLI